MTQDAWIILAFKVVLLSGFISLVTWVVIYTRLTHWGAWKDPIGRTLMAKSLLLALVLVPSILNLFFSFDRFTSHVAGWIDVVLIGAITPVMMWRSLVWLRVGREGGPGASTGRERAAGSQRKGSSGMKNAGQYAKFAIGAASAIITALMPYYGADKWFIALTAALGAALVYIVPNSPPVPASLPPLPPEPPRPAPPL